MDMANTRKKYTAEEKVRILRLHLVEKRPVSDLCDELGLNPNVFYRWQIHRSLGDTRVDD